MKRKASLKNIWEIIVLQSGTALVGCIFSGIFFIFFSLCFWWSGINGYLQNGQSGIIEGVKDSIHHLFYVFIGMFWLANAILVKGKEYKKSEEILKILPITTKENILSKFGGILLLGIFIIVPYLIVYLFDNINEALVTSRGVLSLIYIGSFIIISIINVTRVDERKRRFYNISRICGFIVVLSIPIVVYIFEDLKPIILNKLIMSSFIKNLGERSIGMLILIISSGIFLVFNYMYTKKAVLREEKCIDECY